MARQRQRLRFVEIAVHVRNLQIGFVYGCFEGQGIQLDGTLSKTRAIERNSTPQHAAQVFAGLEHLLENRSFSLMYSKASLM